MNDYKIELPFFTGPFDLLLSLIKANDMDIRDVNIVEIIDQYLAYIELAKHNDLELAGEFLVLAATLIRIKSKTILPASPFDRPEDDPEPELEQISEIQSARQLIEQLVEYRKYKELAQPLAEREEAQAHVFYRSRPPAILNDEQQQELETDFGLLLKAFSKVLLYLDAHQPQQVMKEAWSTAEKMAEILARLEREEYLDATRVFQRCIHKLELITVFLALLELCKQRKIRLRQTVNFGEIHIFKTEEQPEHAETNPAG